MAKGNTEFEVFIADEIKRFRGVLVPIKASFWERLMVRKAKPEMLHPNPDDEFCDPAIGPNYGIIGDYIKMIRQYGSLTPNSWDEPLIVEKVHPDGYMLLNGHHRWGAAIRIGFSPLPISIVNLTQETDIEQMIRHSKHDKRVTLDLDEVVFCQGEDAAEKPFPFPRNKVFKERIRRGIPALFHYLAKQGYDIWVYTAQYYSMEYIRAYFRRYAVQLDGIITGTGRKTKDSVEARKRTEKLFNRQYTETLHIDREALLRTMRDTGTFEEYSIEEPAEEWSWAVMNIVRGLLGEGIKK